MCLTVPLFLACRLRDDRFFIVGCLLFVVRYCLSVVGCCVLFVLCCWWCIGCRALFVRCVWLVVHCCPLCDTRFCGSSCVASWRSSALFVVCCCVRVAYRVSCCGWRLLIVVVCRLSFVVVCCVSFVDYRVDCCRVLFVAWCVGNVFFAC